MSSDRKIKVGFFIDAYKPGAGTENQVRGILRHLDPNQIDATLVTLREPVAPEYRAEIPWPVECLQVGSLHSPASVSKFFRLVGWLRAHRFDIAMIYFVDTNRFVVPACRLAGIRAVVINRRDMGYWYTKSMLFQLNAVNKLASHFLVNSESVRDLVAEKERFPRDRIKVIYNGLWDARQPECVRSRAEFGIPSNAPVVGIIASLRPVKRIDRFIELAKIVSGVLPETRFLILGQGELEQKLRRQASDLGIEARVLFLGQIADIETYLPMFDVGVLTSESEGLSNTLVEYAAAGVPSVAFDTGGNHEVIEDGVSGFLAPEGDIAQMAAKVVKILTDNELKQRLSSRSRKLVGEKFAPGSILRELMAFFKAIR